MLEKIKVNYQSEMGNHKSAIFVGFQELMIRTPPTCTIEDN